MGRVAVRRSKNIWHYCTILSEIGQVDVPLSTKKVGFQKKKKKKEKGPNLFLEKKGVNFLKGRKMAAAGGDLHMTVTNVTPLIICNPN